MTTELKLRNSAASHSLVFGLVQKLVVQIKQQGFDNYQDMKMNPEIVIACLKLIKVIFDKDRTLTTKQKKEIDRKRIVLEALTIVFNLTPEETSFVDKQMIFIMDNKLIKSSFGNFIKSLKKVVGRFF